MGWNPPARGKQEDSAAMGFEGLPDRIEILLLFCDPGLGLC